MFRVGLTGGLGSGKSTVASVFEVLGIPVYYADAAAKRLMNEDPALKEEITKHFGKNAYSNGVLNRQYLASMVFDNKKKLELLNSLVHPVTIRDSEHWMKEQHTPYAIKEAALIFESGSQSELDHIIGVQAPLPLRIRRAINRDHITKEQVLARINKQMDQDMKMELCDSVIINDEEQFVIPQVLAVHEKLLKLAKSSTNH
jgi:dephospho-CoA kinase